MGYFAAHNIHQQQQMRTSTTTTTATTDEAIAKPKFLELDEIPPMIGLAVGKQAVAYWPEAGMTSGEEVIKSFFGDDLGFSSECFPSFVCIFPSVMCVCGRVAADRACSLLEPFEAWRRNEDEVNGTIRWRFLACFAIL